MNRTRKAYESRLESAKLAAIRAKSWLPKLQVAAASLRGGNLARAAQSEAAKALPKMSGISRVIQRVLLDLDGMSASRGRNEARRLLGDARTAVARAESYLLAEAKPSQTSTSGGWLPRVQDRPGRAELLRFLRAHFPRALSLEPATFAYFAISVGLEPEVRGDAQRTSKELFRQRCASWKKEIELARGQGSSRSQRPHSLTLAASASASSSEHDEDAGRRVRRRETSQTPR